MYLNQIRTDWNEYDEQDEVEDGLGYGTDDLWSEMSYNVYDKYDCWDLELSDWELFLLEDEDYDTDEITMIDFEDIECVEY